MAINIMITDDHSMIREGLKNLLELDGDIKVIAEAENGEECLDIKDLQTRCITFGYQYAKDEWS